ncbi:unnamed protein product [Phaeothamnion confervicola]
MPTLGLLYYRQPTAATATATPATMTAAASLELVGYRDANLAGCLDSGRSMTSGLFLLAGGIVAFSSRLQHSVARSTIESEYDALRRRTGGGAATDAAGTSGLGADGANGYP